VKIGPVRATQPVCSGRVVGLVASQADLPGLRAFV
jgi:hypothetical protein